MRLTSKKAEYLYAELYDLAGHSHRIVRRALEPSDRPVTYGEAIDRIVAERIDEYERIAKIQRRNSKPE